MFKKTAATLAMVGTLAFASVSAHASQVRPAAVKLDTAAVQAIGAERPARVATRVGKRNEAVGAGLLLPLLGVAALTIGIVAIASGGNDSSPN